MGTKKKQNMIRMLEFLYDKGLWSNFYIHAYVKVDEIIR